MSYVAYADRDHEQEHHDPDTFITKYIWSQDHKVIAIQYGLTAIFVGLIALGLSAMMRLQLGFPNEFSFINPENYYQFITMHGMIMVIYLLTALFLGGFGNYLIPLMCGSRDMVFPFMNMLSYWVYLLSVIILIASFFVRHGSRYFDDAGIAGRIYCRVHDGWPELRHDGFAGALQRDDPDAFAIVCLGNLHRNDPRLTGIPSVAGERDHDAVRQDAAHQFLHARDQFDGY